MVRGVVFAGITALSISAQAAEGGAKVTITVELESSDGAVYCAMFSKPDGFPGESKKATARIKVKPKNKKATCVFEKIALGTYAVAAYHDENGNKELDTNWVGIPSEPIGVSNNAKGSFGPPKFEDARFQVPASGFKQTIKLE